MVKSQSAMEGLTFTTKRVDSLRVCVSTLLKPFKMRTFLIKLTIWVMGQ